MINSQGQLQSFNECCRGDHCPRFSLEGHKAHVKVALFSCLRTQVFERTLHQPTHLPNFSYFIPRLVVGGVEHPIWAPSSCKFCLLPTLLPHPINQPCSESREEHRYRPRAGERSHSASPMDQKLWRFR